MTVSSEQSPLSSYGQPGYECCIGNTASFLSQYVSSMPPLVNQRVDAHDETDLLGRLVDRALEDLNRKVRPERYDLGRDE
jgi:hypothetical protein